jgi:hypothetical protein
MAKFLRIYMLKLFFDRKILSRSITLNIEYKLENVDINTAEF